MKHYLRQSEANALALTLLPTTPFRLIKRRGWFGLEINPNSPRKFHKDPEIIAASTDGWPTVLVLAEQELIRRWCERCEVQLDAKEGYPLRLCAANDKEQVIASFSSDGDNSPLETFIAWWYENRELITSRLTLELAFLPKTEKVS